MARPLNEFCRSSVGRGCASSGGCCSMSRVVGAQLLVERVHPGTAGMVRPMWLGILVMMNTSVSFGARDGEEQAGPSESSLNTLPFMNSTVGFGGRRWVAWLRYRQVRRTRERQEHLAERARVAARVLLRVTPGSCTCVRQDDRAFVVEDRLDLLAARQPSGHRRRSLPGTRRKPVELSTHYGTNSRMST